MVAGSTGWQGVKYAITGLLQPAAVTAFLHHHHHHHHHYHHFHIINIIT